MKKNELWHGPKSRARHNELVLQILKTYGWSYYNGALRKVRLDLFLRVQSALNGIAHAGNVVKKEKTEEKSNF